MWIRSKDSTILIDAKFIQIKPNHYPDDKTTLTADGVVIGDYTTPAIGMRIIKEVMDALAEGGPVFDMPIE